MTSYLLLCDNYANMTDIAASPEHMRQMADAEAYATRVKAEAVEAPQVNRGWRKALKWGLLIGGVGLVAAAFANPLLGGLGAIFAKGGAGIAAAIGAGGGTATAAATATTLGTAIEGMILSSVGFATPAGGAAAFGGLTTAAVAGGRNLMAPR